MFMSIGSPDVEFLNMACKQVRVSMKIEKVCAVEFVFTHRVDTDQGTGKYFLIF